jgi:hypothetical protein
MRKSEKQMYERIEDSKRVANELRVLYVDEVSRNKELQHENGYLKALFDKEGDTQVIKYNGKLYRITSTTNYVEAGAEETLDFTAVPVREVC